MRKAVIFWSVLGILFLNGQAASFAVFRPRVKPSPTISPGPMPTVSPSPTKLVDTLIFDGTGTSESDAQSLISLVASHGLSYQVVSSANLEAMSLEDLNRFRMIIWPGGDSNVMTDGLSASTRGRIRNAVVNGGVSYVGFCAGAWMGVGPTPPTGVDPYWGVSILNGNYLKEYFPNGQAPVAAMVTISLAGGTSRDLVWWGGPYLPSTSGTTIGKYPDGTAAIIEARAGNGLVILSGPHPEAPQDWRDAIGLVDQDGIDLDFTWTLINHAFQKSWMAVF